MKFARNVFLIAGIYGIIALLPQYFMENKIGVDNPPPITHPEYFYGFIGVGLAWQILFLIIARNPRMYRWVMLPSALEKLSFGCAALMLYSQHRLAFQVVGFGLIDLGLAALFIISFSLVGKESPSLP